VEPRKVSRHVEPKQWVGIDVSLRVATPIVRHVQHQMMPASTQDDADLRGWGGSDKDATSFDLHTQADDVAAIVQSLGLSQYILVGQSMGETPTGWRTNLGCDASLRVALAEPNSSSWLASVICLLWKRRPTCGRHNDGDHEDAIARDAYRQEFDMTVGLRFNCKNLARK
jgi:hypothetical protein